MDDVGPLDCFAPDILEGQTAIVTGGGTGLGREVALALARLGADLVIASRDPSNLEVTAQEIEASGRSCVAVPTDIRDTDDVDRLREAVVDRFGSPHILVNNAGGQFPAYPGSISDRGWRSVVDLNLNGTWNVISRIAPLMVEAGRGSIVNIVHIFSFERGATAFVHSGAARAGVVNLTQSLAQFAGRAGVRVNAVAPGTVDTAGMLDNEAGPIEDMAGLADLLGDVAAGIPAGRIAETSEIASAIVFLCTPASRWVNGVALRVDGGEYAGHWPAVDRPAW
ncbi:SDR family NAD(P)-dependent oxidoreductase [Rhabdothermincola salaria]|uniref:SDR family NAD(P)-dependent oxidoreductase n=1 Tax=Rhabdothermincola salaria TaxID=2903142 RepID=UPI001E2C0288|nr:SDR family oxidoreductase [Rhabdothermincola salaria]MCD9624143.1 SDR family oxidoreductase [Rhabdothermincola salaria]